MSDKQVFGTMNGLRGIAALVVVVFHLPFHESLNLENGFLAVDLFFVLSGFVIAYSYEERLRKGLSFKEFFLIRLVRFYPLYILGTLLAILKIFISIVMNGRVIEVNANGFNAIPEALLMLPTIPQTVSSDVPLYPLNIVAWSLFFELVINVIYALSFRFWTTRIISITLICTGSALVLISMLGEEDFGQWGWVWASFHLGFLRVLYSFPAGVLIFRFYQKKSSFPSIPIPIIMALFLVLLMLPSAWGVLFSVLIGFPLLVSLAARTEPQSILSPIFATIGTASYAIYAIHQPLHGFISATFNTLKLPVGTPVDVILIVLIVPICLLLDRLYDIPLRKYLARKLLSRSKTDIPASTQGAVLRQA